MDEKLFEMPVIDFCEYEVEEIMTESPSDTDYQSEIEEDSDYL